MSIIRVISFKVKSTEWTVRIVIRDRVATSYGNKKKKKTYRDTTVNIIIIQ